MTDIVYVNGDYVPANEAKVSIYDRGFLFADAIYEVAAVLDGGLVDVERHLARLEGSLAALKIETSLSMQDFQSAMLELVKRNAVREGLIYVQVSRGSGPRQFNYLQGVTPTVVMFPMRKAIIEDPALEKGMSVTIVPDLRWQRCDIKTVGLLGAAMAKQAAVEAGVDDAWMERDGLITEGSSNNAFIVSPTGVLITRSLGNEILPGITRRVVLELAEQAGLAVEERAFSVAEAKSAREAFITSASSFVMPVTSIDGQQIGDGVPGALTLKLRQGYIDLAKRESVLPA